MSKGGAIRWTDAQLAEFQVRNGKRIVSAAPRAKAAPAPAAPPVKQQGPGEAFYALGRVAKGRMNKTEAAYAQLLEAQKHDGKIIDWKFHVLRVRLADNTFYEPDFLVLTADRELQIHETKGSFTTQAGQTKIKLCAEVLPWFRVLKASKQKDGSFTIQDFS